MTSKVTFTVVKRVAAATGLGLFVLLLASLSVAQQLTGTLNGTTFDSSGAVVPNAKIVMHNENSGDTRTSVSNSSGYFAITAVQPGTYTITVSAAGFKNWKETGIVFNQGDSRTLPNISLQVGAVNETVEISAGADAVVPIDNAEVSTTVNGTMVQDLLFSGRDAGDLLKLMPGMALNNGGSQGSAFNTKVVGTNNGPVGAYSANGTQPNGAMSYMLDGANLVDPGNMGTQIANINQDMVAEVKVLMSSYSAEYAKGPVIFQAISKSGGNQFHGQGYLYARNSALNSWDSYASGQYQNYKSLGHTPAEISTFAQTLHGDDSFYYMGGNIGGPIAFKGFNASRKKLFFWAGYEYMKQKPAGQALNFNVPTPEQLSGIFDSTHVPSGALGAWGYAYGNPGGVANSVPIDTNGSSACGGTGQLACTGVQIPSSEFDPNIAGIAALYPKPNTTANEGNGWNNYTYASSQPQNRWEATGKVDYAISDNTKLSVSYTRQIETDQHPIAIWWAPAWTLPYPSPISAATTSQAILTNFTHVFSPTTTNEFVFTYARYINPSTLSKPGAVDRGNLGFNVQGLFGHTTKQMPNFYGPWGGAFPDWREFSFEGSFNGGAFGGLKKDPALYDNFTKVIRSHTLKAGFYWDTSQNIQSSSGQDNGVYNLGWGANSTGNVVADFLLGRTGNYQQQSSIPVQDLKFHQWSIYGQDSFKATRRLTLNYGMRFDHVGQWYGPRDGAQVWDPASYDNTPACPSSAPPDCVGPPNNTGLLWHAIDKRIPVSGFESPLFYYEPRVGLAYDLFGTGRTVLRGGFAVFRYQVSTEVGGAFNGPLGSFLYTTASTTGYDGTPNSGYAQIQSGAAGFTPPSTQAQNGTGISALQRGDNRTPKTVDWNVTLSQALPWRSVFEISYVGNKSTNEWINGNNDKVNDANSVPAGGYFQPDPTITNANNLVSPHPLPCGSNTAPPDIAVDCSSAVGANYLNAFSENHFRPLVNYQDIYVLTHGAYANYNSLQMSWQKQSGPVTFLLNYTFSKVLGIRDGSSDNGAGNGKAVDPFILANNYAPLAYDHTHILNLSYVWNLPKFVHGHKLVEGAINGWQISGYTTYQSGAPLQTSTGGNLNATYNNQALTVPTVSHPDLPDNSIPLPNGLKSVTMDAATWFGTSQNGGGYTALLPKLTCDPRKHASGLYFNPNCFAPPAYGEQGNLIWPYLRNPAYFNSDLALFKNFQVSERQKLQFRISATNWLNHPLPQFGLAGNRDEALDFTNVYTVTSQGAPATAVGISPTNTNTTTTGKPGFRTGSRILTFTVKYFF